MSLENYQFDTIMRAYNRKQYHHRHLLNERRQTAYAALPALKDLDDKEADASVVCAQKLFAGEASAQDELAQALSLIGDKRKTLLLSGGFPEDYLDMTYDCPLCKDTGFTENGQKCICFLKAATDLLYQESNHRAQYEKENFSTFRLDCYDRELIDPVSGKSAYALACSALATAQKYAARFTDAPGASAEAKDSPIMGSLLIYGPTGVGKTFLSNCIARELIETVHSVVHVSAMEFFDLLAAHQFRQEEDAMYESVLGCDLLIIDDLGTEIANSFIINSLCQCVDSRLKHDKGTIITTNLELADLKAQYLDRTFSRLISGYTLVRMAGSDIRLQRH